MLSVSVTIRRPMLAVHPIYLIVPSCLQRLREALVTIGTDDHLRRLGLTLILTLVLIR